MDKTRIALEVLITVREGMIAENGQCVYSGQAPAYVGDNFQELADQIGSLGREKASLTIGDCLDEETGIYDSMAIERAKEQAWKREAWREVIRLIKARQREINDLGRLTKYGAGRLYGTQEICTAVEELCSP